MGFSVLMDKCLTGVSKISGWHFACLFHVSCIYLGSCVSLRLFCFFAHVRELQATHPAWTWATSWWAWSRRTAGSAWSVRPAPCASSPTTRTRWCSATCAIEDITPSAWAWIPYLQVFGYVKFATKISPRPRRKEELKHPKRTSQLRNDQRFH